MALDRQGRIVPDAPVTGWQVQDQVPTTELDARSVAVRGYRVHFLTGKGQQGSVFVPENRYTTLNVRAQVAAAAAQLDEIAGLSG